MNIIDARGMSCPQPVLMTKNALKKSPDIVQILVDNETAKGNIERYLSHEGFFLEFQNQDDDILIMGRK
ncbi:sulfurtransferase TusA family protein [Gudongella sp. SC589]|uniref:sulfurtransferase TusA family protein n=1 Tax=Gudongella sp. SC589 TaxID=3385990 RepID=UPI003904800C